MKIRIFYIVLLFLYSCQQVSEVQKPKNFIGEDKLVKILVDASIHSAAKSQDRRLMEAKNVDVVAFLKTKYNIDTLTLRENINYYAADTENYNRIQERVKRILETEKAKYDRINEEQDKARKAKMEAAKKKHAKVDSLPKLQLSPN